MKKREKEEKQRRKEAEREKTKEALKLPKIRNKKFNSNKGKKKAAKKPTKKLIVQDKPVTIEEITKEFDEFELMEQQNREQFWKAVHFEKEELKITRSLNRSFTYSYFDLPLHLQKDRKFLNNEFIREYIENSYERFKNISDSTFESEKV
jgi:maltodextrin utilization protein YvdJ